MSPIKKKKISSTKKITPRVIKPLEVRPAKLPSSLSPSLRLYRRIVGGFAAAIILVFGAIVILSTTKATIQVTPLVKTIEASFLVGIVKEGAAEDELSGTVIEQTFEQAKSFSVSGVEQKEVLDKAGGEVTIINDSSKNQPLVATTRLLSSGGVLFRLDESVMVPAGGQIIAMVHADQVGPTGDIGPDKFTIPGLATVLQKSIYAESSEAMTGGQRMVSLVTQEELDKDAGDLMVEMLAAAKEQLRLQGKGNWTGEVFSFETVSKKSDTEPGEEKDNVTISLKLKVAGVFFDVNTLNVLSETKLYENLEDGFVFKEAESVVFGAATESNQATVEIVQASATGNTAELRTVIKKDSIISNTSAFLQPEVLVGKSKDEVKDYLVSAGVASDVRVKIFPPWIMKVPKMLDHIIVKVIE